MKKLVMYLLSLSLSIISCVHLGVTKTIADVNNSIVTVQMLRDNSFKSSFIVTENGTNSFNLNNGNQVSNCWTYNQYNSTYTIDANNYSTEGTAKIYGASSEKKLGIDSTGGAVYFYADTSYDYLTPRTVTQAVVSTELRQEIKNNVAVASVESLWLSTDFIITECTDLNSAYDANLHTAQIQIALTVQNLNVDSTGYGDYFLYVLPLYDARYNYAPSYDNGACDSSNKKYVYNPSATEFLSSVTTLNSVQSINFDIKDKIYNTFNSAKEKAYLGTSAWEDMYISSFSIIQSLPGTYKIGSHFSNVGLNYTVQTQNAYADEDYLNGFSVYTTQEGNGTIVGNLKKDTSTTTPSWTIAQWNSQNDIVNGYRSIQDDLWLWGDNSKQVFVRPQTHTLGLLMNASSEYTADRVQNQPWPCILLNQEFDFNNHVKISELSSLIMNVDFNITKMENHMVGEVDPNLHAAQLLWYITVQNRNVNSVDFGKYVWFGLQLYDSRYEFCPFFANEDGGKEVNTGMFIYLQESQNFIQDVVVPNRTYSIQYNAYEKICEAFALAQSRGYLMNTTFDDLYIGGMNIGWELPGTYDVCVEISDLNLYPVY